MKGQKTNQETMKKITELYQEAFNKIRVLRLKRLNILEDARRQRDQAKIDEIKNSLTEL